MLKLSQKRRVQRGVTVLVLWVILSREILGFEPMKPNKTSLYMKK